jgi:cytochrome c-type biogenesis protein CcmH
MSMRRFIALFTLLLLGMATLAAAQSPRDDAELEAMVRNLAAQLRCPVCQGVSIQDSPTELAFEMKAVIRQQLVDGKSPEEVKAYFTERYGEWVLLQPKAEGFNLIVYVLPFAVLLVGVGFVYKTIQRWSHDEPSELRASVGASPQDADEDA